MPRKGQVTGEVRPEKQDDPKAARYRRTRRKVGKPKDSGPAWEPARRIRTAPRPEWSEPEAARQTQTARAPCKATVRRRRVMEGTVPEAPRKSHSKVFSDHRLTSASTSVSVV